MINSGSEFQQLLFSLEQADPEAFEKLEEEINIVHHKLKFIAEESRPKVALISNIRDFSQDFQGLTREALQIAGGSWLLGSDLSIADKIILVQQDASLYADLPVVLQEDFFASSPAVKHNELYIVQQDAIQNKTADNFLRQVEVFAEIIQPKYFIYGRNGSDWVQFAL